MKLKKIIIADDPFDKEGYEEFLSDNFLKTIQEKYPSSFPKNARIYQKSVALENDITPDKDELSIKKLIELIDNSEDNFYIINYPDGIETIIAVVIVVIVVAAAVVLTATPAVPSASLKNTQQSSPNNELSERTNKPRVNGRIPDIFGTVRSTPDLIAVPY